MNHSHKPSSKSIFGYRRRSMSSQQPKTQAPPQQPPQAQPRAQHIAPTPPSPQHHHQRASSNAGTVSSSSSRSSMNLEPSPAVAEWCHQMHMIQNRKYDWCQGCHPRVVMLPVAPPAYYAEVPSERALERRRMEREASHAYQ